jgi:hypothetical protein
LKFLKALALAAAVLIAPAAVQAQPLNVNTWVNTAVPWVPVGCYWAPQDPITTVVIRVPFFAVVWSNVTGSYETVECPGPYFYDPAFLVRYRTYHETIVFRERLNVRVTNRQRLSVNTERQYGGHAIVVHEGHRH